MSAFATSITADNASAAGLVISAQWPPTARGMGFIVPEDETGRVQVALQPKLAESCILAVGGKFERAERSAEQAP